MGTTMKKYPAISLPMIYVVFMEKEDHKFPPMFADSHPDTCSIFDADTKISKVVVRSAYLAYF